MWKLRLVLVIGAALVVAGFSHVDAQIDCRTSCEAAFKQCKDDCATARDVDDCVSKCREFLRQCQASCE